MNIPNRIGRTRRSGWSFKLLALFLVCLVGSLGCQLAVVNQTASVEVVASFPASAQGFSAAARFSEKVDQVEVEVTDEAGNRIGEVAVLKKDSEGQYRGKIEDLPLGKTLTFKATAKAGGTDIFHGSATHTFDKEQWEVEIKIELRPNNDEISLPGIESISYPQQVLFGTSVAVRFQIIKPVMPALSYAITADANGGSFGDASGTVPDTGIVDATYTANHEAGTFEHAIVVTNTATGDVVTARFKIKNAGVTGAIEILFYPAITNIEVDHQSNGTIKLKAFGVDNKTLPEHPFSWTWYDKDDEKKDPAPFSTDNPVEITSFPSNKELSVTVTDADGLPTSVKVTSVSAVTPIELPYAIEITQGNWNGNSGTCYIEAQAQLTARGFYVGKDAETVTDHVVWKSSDTQVVTVDNGKVQAVARGSATVTASLGSTSAISVQTPDGACVTYLPNGAHGGSVPLDTNDYEEGQTVTVTVLPNTGGLRRPGYSFIGWNTKADGNGTNYKGGDTFEMGAANVTLYAVWSFEHCDLDFDERSNLSHGCHNLINGISVSLSGSTTYDGNEGHGDGMEYPPGDGYLYLNRFLDDDYIYFGTHVTLKSFYMTAKPWHDYGAPSEPYEIMVYAYDESNEQVWKKMVDLSGALDWSWVRVDVDTANVHYLQFVAPGHSIFPSIDNIRLSK